MNKAIIFIVALFLSFSFVLADFESDCNYKVQINITNPDASDHIYESFIDTHTDRNINITSATNIGTPSYDNVRLVKDDVEMPFNITAYGSGWVEIEAILNISSSDETGIYLYYGCSGLGTADYSSCSTWDICTPFIAFYEDFDGSYDLSDEGWLTESLYADSYDDDIPDAISGIVTGDDSQGMHKALTYPIDTSTTDNVFTVEFLAKSAETGSTFTVMSAYNQTLATGARGYGYGYQIREPATAYDGMGWLGGSAALSFPCKSSDSSTYNVWYLYNGNRDEDGTFNLRRNNTVLSNDVADYPDFNYTEINYVGMAFYHYTAVDYILLSQNKLQNYENPSTISLSAEQETGGGGGGDTTNPVVNINSPSSGYVNDTLIQSISVTCYDNVEVEYIKLYVNGTLNLTNSTPVNNSAWVFDFTATSYTNYTLQFECSDNSSNAVNTSVLWLAFQIVPDTTNPVITLNNPSSQNVNDALTKKINVTCYDDIEVEYIKLYVNGTLNLTNSTPVNNSAWVFDFDAFDYTNFTLFLECLDNSSNSANTSTIWLNFQNTTDYNPTVSAYDNVTTTGKNTFMLITVNASDDIELDYIIIEFNFSKYPETTQPSVLFQLNSSYPPYTQAFASNGDDIIYVNQETAGGTDIIEQIYISNGSVKSICTMSGVGKAQDFSYDPITGYIYTADLVDTNTIWVTNPDDCSNKYTLDYSYGTITAGVSIFNDSVYVMPRTDLSGPLRNEPEPWIVGNKAANSTLFTFTTDDYNITQLASQGWGHQNDMFWIVYHNTTGGTSVNNPEFIRLYGANGDIISTLEYNTYEPEGVAFGRYNGKDIMMINTNEGPGISYIGLTGTYIMYWNLTSTMLNQTFNTTGTPTSQDWTIEKYLNYEGDFSYRVYAYDNNGNYNVTDWITFTVEELDTTPPTIDEINCTSPSPPDTTEPFTTTDNTPTFNMITSENATCGISDTNSSYAECSTTGGTLHICTINTTQAMPDGSPYVYFNCTDILGNNATYSYEMYIDTWTSLTYNSPSSQTYYDRLTVELSTTGYDMTKVSNISRYVNGTLNLTNSTPVNNSAWVNTLEVVNFANYSVYFKSWDNMSNTNTTESRWYFFIDNAPVISSTSPSSAQINDTKIVQLSVTSYDNFTLSTIRLYVNGTLNLTNSTPVNNSAWVFDFTATEYTNYTIIFEAIDSSGSAINSSEKWYYFYQNDYYPNVTINSPSSQTQYTLNTVTLNVTADDEINLSTIRLYVNGTLNLTNSTPVNNSAWVFDFTPSTYTNYTLYFTATDGIGQSTNSSTIWLNFATLPVNYSWNTSNWIHYWTHDNSNTSGVTSYDLIGTKDGTLVNGVVTNQTGQIYQSYFFGASNRYVSITNPFPDSSYTLTVWAKRNSTSSRDDIFYMYNATFPKIKISIDSDSDDKIYWESSGNGVNCNIKGSTTISDTDWHLYTMIMNDSGNMLYGYVDNVLDTSSACTATNFDYDPSLELPIGNTYSHVLSFDGFIDEISIWNTTLNTVQRTDVYNQGLLGLRLDGLTLEAARLSTNLSYPINATYYAGTYNGSIILSLFDVNGSINCTLNNTSWILQSINNETAHFYNNNVSIGNQSISYSCNDTGFAWSNSTFWFYNSEFAIESVTFSDNITYLGKNYVRELAYSINYTCAAVSNTTIEVYINNSYIESWNLICNNNFITFTNKTISDSEGNYSLRFLLNTSLNPSLNNVNSSIYYFIWDLNNPSLDVEFTSIAGFNNATTNITMVCDDDITPLLLYNLSLNSVVLNYDNQTNNTLIWNMSTLNNGNNTARGLCSDFFGSTSYNTTTYVYAKLLALIDEKENTAFDVLNISGARVYFDDNSSFYDFQAANTSQVNFTTTTTEKLRFELVYSDGSIITRYIDITLIDDDEVRVCANKEGVTHYEQLILSALEKKALLKNVFSNCYVAADYTRFAYQDAFILKAYTIASMYYLNAELDGIVTYLASVDGSIPTYINLDTLEFQQTAYDLDILNDAISVHKSESDNDIVEIYYKNIADDNTDVVINIWRMDTGDLVFNTTETSSPNEWLILFDKSTLTNVTNTTLFKVQLEKNTDTSTSIIKRYFNFGGSTGVLSSGVAFVIAILITFFGLTFTVARLTFSYFGVIVQIISIAVISFATMTWYLLFLLGMNVIILVFIILLMFKQNYPTVS